MVWWVVIVRVDLCSLRCSVYLTIKCSAGVFTPMSREVTEQTTDLVTRIATLQKSKWADRFIVAAIVQGALAAGLTSYLLYQAVFGSPAPSRIVANMGGAGNGGIWLTVGYLVYLPLGPIAAAVTALFYRQLEGAQRKPYTGKTNIFPWLHIVLMNVGIVGGTWLMMNAGYRAGAAALPASSGGLGWTSLQIHTNILVGYPPYIAAFFAVAIAGAIAGGLGYILVWRRPVKLLP